MTRNEEVGKKCIYMIKFLENIKTLIIELIGSIIGCIWAINTNWGWDSLIFFTISFVGFLISLALIVLKKKQPTNIKIPTIGVPLNSTISNIKPLEIEKLIDNASLYQRREIAKSYVGLMIRWQLKLFMISKREDGKIFVAMRSIDEAYITIKFETDTAKYPILKVAEDHKQFSVLGNIIDCEEHYITLELLELQEI